MDAHYIGFSDRKLKFIRFLSSIKAEARCAGYITRDDCSAPVRGADPLRPKRAHAQRPASRADRRLDPRIWLHQPGADRRRGRHYRRRRPGARRAFARPRRGAVHRPACGFETRSQIIWAKNNFAIGRGHYHCKHEPCWYVVRKGSPASWVGDHSQTTLWQIDKNLKSETGHGTQKPVECMRRPIENNASPGQAVYGPFSGSGTTIIAAEMTGRVCHAIEIAPAYVDVAVKRWQEVTRQPAVLDGDGRSFDNVAAQRAR